MRITLLCMGKTDEGQLAAIIDKFQQRLKHYIPFNMVHIPDVKNTKHLRADQQRAKEAAAILKQLSPGDQVVLLDERGKECRSVDFAAYLNKLMVGSVQHLVFVVGGPYGFDESVHQRANGQLSLSKMTFSHQMVRLFFVEQLYRAFTILKGEPYHHE
ncbi:23S rRNA (pseudouridine(1915)-N(3))-methyltransferase RlmH [Parapedobacter sp. 10938]|uniref:23S rRNA (pseudouridine(1915)-N(3))-methyltransferase RlmH n=1 Tax=Parapedobacter flavus TaxID=3110225 RepID=UPI002DBDCF6D|nr:23S rRNA (pseudouridine(1915)-N(3))-methyltransferase RlmH [Parapedobacter sp. 10938]MEC3881011.1 23S rRNA (pseudouridine(1915)-N(3))-methyltransferase RlmH [Parapedobacter sp. 10938]